eukprot:393739_1
MDRATEEEKQACAHRMKVVKRNKKPDEKWIKKGSVLKSKQTNGVAETSIIDWLTHNGYPLCIILNNSKTFDDKNINKISDFSTINDDELAEMLNSLEISDSVQKSRLTSDIMGCILKFKHGVNDPNRSVSETQPEADAIDKDGKVNTELRYLGLYKVVILDYLYHKRIETKPIFQMDKNGQQNYLAQVSIYVPDQIITGFSIGAEAVIAQYYAYKNLYDQLIVNEKLVDKKAFNGLIRKYQIIKHSINTNSNYKLFLYFGGFKQFKRSNEYEKAQYFFNKNMDDATCGKDKWINIYIPKQTIWFHGFYYLFCDEIE